MELQAKLAKLDSERAELERRKHLLSSACQLRDEELRKVPHTPLNLTQHHFVRRSKQGVLESSDSCKRLADRNHQTDRWLYIFSRLALIQATVCFASFVWTLKHVIFVWMKAKMKIATHK